MTIDNEPNCLDYFSGGVPTGEILRMTLEDLARTVDRAAHGFSRINEICFIGLVSYFEAFCKDHFASILNIEPSLLGSLRENGQDIQIDPSRLLDFRNNWLIRLGFLVAEKFDFGTAHKINALYGALLHITPFSKDESKYYEAILRDRNLFVHHGGTVTFAYSKQSTIAPVPKAYRPFFDSLVVTPEYFDERLAFIISIARKLLKASHSAVLAYAAHSGSNYDAERSKAVDALLWCGDDSAGTPASD
jgi:hypothetical protein